MEIEDAHVQIHDPELRKILNPTTADLRFADYLVKHVTENRDDVFLDGTGWEGGDEWIRAQFSAYLHALLASVLQPDNEKTLSDFGTAFVAAWKILTTTEYGIATSIQLLQKYILAIHFRDNTLCQMLN